MMRMGLLLENEVSEVHKTLLTNKTTFTQTTEKIERGRTEDNTQHIRFYGYGFRLSYANERC